MVAVPNRPPAHGNAIVKPPIAWHTLIVMALIVGVSVWIVEQYVDPNYAFFLALILLLGVAYNAKGFAAELNDIMSGKA